MKIFVFSDLHGSLNALRKIMELDDFKTADQRIFLGDITVGCARPEECINLIKVLPCKFLIGNNDAYVADKIPKVDEPANLNCRKFEQILWMRENVSKENKRYLMSLDRSYVIKEYGKTLYFSHYLWEYDNGEFNVMDSPLEAPNQTRDDLLNLVDADYVFIGHEHTYCHHEKNGRHLYICGTAGLVSPASYLLVELTEKGVTVTEKHFEFDLGEEIDYMDRAGYHYNKRRIKKTD